MDKTIKEQTNQAVKVCIGLSIASIVLSVISGCGGPQGPQGVAGQVTVVTPSPSPTPNAIQTVVSSYNEYRVSVGQDPITPGLDCTLYTISNPGSNNAILAADGTANTLVNVGSWTYTGVFNQPEITPNSTLGMNILPMALQGLPQYQSWFEVKCTGFFVSTDYNYFEFDTSSDDGSILYINGGVVVNNDKLHSLANVSAEKYLEAQVYTFELDYFQGPGQIGLVVNMNGSVLPAANLYH